MNTLVLKRIHKHLFLTGSFFVILSLAGCSLQKYDSILPEEKKSIVQSVPEQSASEPQGSETEPEQDEFADMSHKELLQIFYQTMKEDCYNPDNQLEKHTSFFMLDKYYSFFIHYDGHSYLSGVQCNNRPGPEHVWGGHYGRQFSVSLLIAITMFQSLKLLCLTSKQRDYHGLLWSEIQTIIETWRKKRLEKLKSF